MPRILIIDKINELDLNDQGKFGEILKYKKVSTFDLPEDTIIFLTVKNLKEHRVAENIFTLCACI